MIRQRRITEAQSKARLFRQKAPSEFFDGFRRRGNAAPFVSQFVMFSIDGGGRERFLLLFQRGAPCQYRETMV